MYFRKNGVAVFLVVVIVAVIITAVVKAMAILTVLEIMKKIFAM